MDDNYDNIKDKEDKKYKYEEEKKMKIKTTKKMRGKERIESDKILFNV